MSTASSDGGIQSIYNFWLGLIPQFFGQMGAGMPGGENGAAAAFRGLAFPADQVARAATMTQEALQKMTQAYMPMLHAAGAPGLLGQWAAAMPFAQNVQAMPGVFGAAAPGAKNTVNPWAAAMAMFPGMQAQRDEAGKAAAAALDMPGAWIAMLPFGAGAQAMAGDAEGTMTRLGMMPLQTMQKVWTDFGMQVSGTTPHDYSASFDRTFGALSDALGFGPLRKLQTAWQELLAASFAQNDARARYAVLVHNAFGAGLEGLLRRLAEMAEKGERVDSVLALLKMWAVNTEEAVHSVLQSGEGLAATATVARAGLAYRRKIQSIAAIIADGLDMATRRDVDEAHRAIQELKREVRKLRHAARPVEAARKARATNTKRGTKQ